MISNSKYLFYAVLLLVLLTGCGKPDKVWISSWQETSQMTVARAGAAYVVHGKFVYAIAGVDGRNFLSSIERAEVNSDGSLGSWQVIGQLPEPRGFISATIYRDRLYVVGGGNGPYGENLLNTVVSAPIGKDGNIGEWRTEQNTMLVPRRCAKIFVHNNALYSVGGFGGTLLDTVESAPFESSGELGDWRLQTEKLNTPRYVNELKQTGNVAFALGGHHANSGKGIATVEYLDLKTRNASWREAGKMSHGRYAFASAVIKDNIYVLGGLSGAEYLDSIEYVSAKDLQQGGSWKLNTLLPENMANFSALNIKDKIYLFGGSTRQGYLKNVWYADVNKNGQIGYLGTGAELKDIKQKKSVAKEDALPNQGVVLERLDTSDYTYMRIKNETSENWIAAPKNNIPVNAIVNYSEGVYMSNFYSKSLKRNFSAVLFVGTVKEK